MPAEPRSHGAIDSHAHVGREVYGEGLERVLARAWQTGVAGIVSIATGDSPLSYAETVALAHSDRRIWAAAGIHPHYASRRADLWSHMLDVLADPRVVALGEFGLDFHYMHSPRESQIEAMKMQIEEALDRSLPVVLHLREAHEEALAILDTFGHSWRGVIHCFTGTFSQAKDFLERGFHLSIPGVVTFGARARDLEEAVCSIPLDRMLVETDSPYLSPTPFRGKRNEPAHVGFVVDKIAELRSTDPEQIAAATARNTRCIFSLDTPEHHLV